MIRMKSISCPLQPGADFFRQRDIKLKTVMGLRFLYHKYRDIFLTNRVPVLSFLDSPVKPGNDKKTQVPVIPRLDRGIQCFKMRYRIYADVY